MNRFEPKTPVCFISTHLDDVALSCSHFISAHPNNIVMTAMTGAPKIYRDKNKDWNAKTTGEAYAPNALAARRKEDLSAMSLLKSKPVWIDLPESLYVEGDQNVAQIAHKISSSLEREAPASVVFPLGIHHSDHIAVSDACMELSRRTTYDFYLYLDMPYANKLSSPVWERLSKLADLGYQLEPLEPYEARDDIKKKVFALYLSQLSPIKKAFEDFNETMQAPELYWRLLSKHH